MDEFEELHGVNALYANDCFPRACIECGLRLDTHISSQALDVSATLSNDGTSMLQSTEKSLAKLVKKNAVAH